MGSRIARDETLRLAVLASVAFVSASRRGRAGLADARRIAAAFGTRGRVARGGSARSRRAAARIIALARRARLTRAAASSVRRADDALRVTGTAPGRAGLGVTRARVAAGTVERCVELRIRDERGAPATGGKRDQPDDDEPAGEPAQQELPGPCSVHRVHPSTPFQATWGPTARCACRETGEPRRALRTPMLSPAAPHSSQNRP